MSIYKFKNPLYHGSRGGIVGHIQPVSRIRCDFGQGFYMGTNPIQAKTLVANDQAPYFYKLELDIGKLQETRILELKDMEWAYFVLYNRGKLECLKGTDFYKNYKYMSNEKDLIVGPIADDAMNEAMNRFVNNLITDKAFLESIKALDYGIQYVAKTEEACNCIRILEERELYGKELDDAIARTAENRKMGRSMAEKMQVQYLRQGNYFVEILREIQQTQQHFSKGVEK